MTEYIQVPKSRLIAAWAALTMGDQQEAYHQLYMAHDDADGSDPYQPWRQWWTKEDEAAALAPIDPVDDGPMTTEDYDEAHPWFHDGDMESR